MSVQKDLLDQKRNLMNDPDARNTVHLIAKEHGMSVEDAQTLYIRLCD